MILIADSGSTKTDWILTDGQQNQIRYSTIGYNPYFINTDNIYTSLSDKLTLQFDASKVKKVYFYGAGCSSDEKSNIVSKALSRCFQNSEISIKHDLLGAARALLGNNRGFAAIIGTGSNTCIYDGTEIEKNIDSLGYILGDEGSGSHIGKKILQNFMRGYFPSELEKKFDQTYKVSKSEIFDSIYNKPLPNRFLASFCKFADENKEHEFVRDIVHESFNFFFKRLVQNYPEHEKYSFNCVGSVGYIFKDILEEVSRSYSMQIGNMICSPIDDLAKYHLNQAEQSTKNGN